MSAKKTPNNKRKHNSSSSESDQDSIFHDAPVSKHSTPSPRKVVTKHGSTDSDDSEDEGMQIKIKTPLISPLEAMKHLENIKEKQGSKDPSMKHAISSYCSEVKGIDSKELQASLTKYLHIAIQPTKLNLSTGSAMMNDFFNGPNALKYIPGFPHKPKNLLFCYAALNDIDNGLGMLKEAADRMKGDEKGRAKAEKEADKQRAAYAESLQSFLEINEDKLSEIQKKNIQTTFKRIDKSMHPEKYLREKTPGSAKRKKKEPMSAFEHFKSLSSNLYIDLEPEKRTKKLQKKFDKLEPSVREVYEKLALRD
ncbi:hypothetical protein PMAYCL1PPCAC_21063 [Pristionchus mayeri]|uniref:Uncharacterized protein n=1 Tax=Pristionchus mayeri TaxID=1317129 RepID=A0AAN5CU16_9BILA|nr:hypothetical protein PMAYCL1PPCAC_21063 [Pristionchus mayeri]